MFTALRAESVVDARRDRLASGGSGGRYRVVRRVGEDATGAVFEAVDTGTGVRVAIKRPSEPSVPAPSSFEHPNLAPVLDAGIDAQGAFVVQALPVGESLATRIATGARLGVHEALELLVPVVGGVAAAYDQRAMRAAINARNIVLATGTDGETVPRLLAFALDGGYEPLDRDARAQLREDLAATGALMCELLTGVPASPRVAPLAQRAPHVPAALVDLIERAMSDARDLDFPTMRVFLAALAGCVPWDDQGHERAPTQTPRDEHAGLAEVSARTTLVSIAVPRPGRPTTRLRRAGSGVAAVVALAGALVLLRGGHTPADAGRALLRRAPLAATALEPITAPAAPWRVKVAAAPHATVATSQPVVTPRPSRAEPRRHHRWAAR